MYSVLLKASATTSSEHILRILFLRWTCHVHLGKEAYICFAEKNDKWSSWETDSLDVDNQYDLFGGSLYGTDGGFPAVYESQSHWL